MVDDWLWTTDALGRLSADGKTREFFKELGDDRRSNYEWAYLERIGDGRQVLACDGRRVWLLKLPAKEKP